MKRFRKLFLILFLLIVGGYGIVAILRGPARGFTKSLLEEKKTQTVSGPSFKDDKDRDGLSDGKEAIFGTNPENPDTDGDGFTDGEEVRKGFDPTLGGEKKISENTALMGNLTIRYFEWARTVAKVDDPQLNDQAIGTFLNAENLTHATLVAVDDAELTKTDATGPDALRAYFDALGSVTLPDVTGSYTDIADEVIKTKRSEILDNVVKGLDETYNAMRAIPVPQEARDVHKTQLAFLKTLRLLFTDLYTIEHDPVLLMRDIAWSKDLIERYADVSKKLQELAAKATPRATPTPEPPTPSPY